MGKQEPEIRKLQAQRQDGAALAQHTAGPGPERIQVSTLFWFAIFEL